MNQRPLKRNKAVFNDNGSMLRQVINFAEEAEELLEQQGEEDAAFYFGQVEDWLRDGGRIQTGHNDVARILGV